MGSIYLDGDSLSLETFKSIVCDNAQVELNEDTWIKLTQSRNAVDKVVEKGEQVYGINTGFGVLSSVTIEPNKLEQLQKNIIQSHCAGVGDPHTERESRAILLLRTNVLAKGYSGVRPELVQLLVDMLNKKVHPVIPTKGSVGASGDLAPLAHLASVVIGDGEAFYNDQRLPGAEALKLAGLNPITLAPKEGLSLINGTQQMTAIGCLAQLEGEQLLNLAELISTASLEGVLGTPNAYQAWVHDVRPYPGQIESAAKLSAYLEDSEIVESHKDCDKVQDAYSFRCVPQVHGAIRELVQFSRRMLSIELNAATDNPLVNYKTGQIVSGGNFHGQPVAFTMDILGMALAELGSLSERRTAKLVDPAFSGLPTFLVKKEGLNSGFMMAHVTAAALVSENRGLTHPGSTDSIPTNVEKEDHVSMGPWCARKATQILRNTQHILAIEALGACQALEFRKPLKPGKGPRRLLSAVRKVCKPLDRDRYLYKDIEAVTQTIRSGALYSQVHPRETHHIQSRQPELR